MRIYQYLVSNTPFYYSTILEPQDRVIAHSEWNIGDGLGWIKGAPSSVLAKWMKPGVDTVQVRLTDKDSNIVILKSAQVKVVNPKAIVKIASICDLNFAASGLRDTVITPSDTVQFSLVVSDPNGVAKVIWVFGDGTSDSTSGESTQSIKHVYPGPDVIPKDSEKYYVLGLSVVDSFGDTSSFARVSTIKIVNVGPKITSARDTSCYADSTLNIKIAATDLGRGVRYEWSTDGNYFRATLASDTTFKMPNQTTPNFMIYVRAANEDGSLSKMDTIRVIVYGLFEDSLRDHQKYKYIKIGSQTWMAQNLNYAVDSSWCYINQPDSCRRYGRLYTWTAAMGISASYEFLTWGGADSYVEGICPTGWRLPSKSDWDTLLVGMPGADNVQKSLALFSQQSNSRGFAGKDLYGFHSLVSGSASWEPFGDRVFTSNAYTGSKYWTALEFSQTIATQYILGLTTPATADKKTEAISVRCLKN